MQKKRRRKVDKKNLERLVEIDLNLIRERDPQLAMKVYSIYRQYQLAVSLLESVMESEREARSKLVSVDTERKALKKEVEQLRVQLTRIRSMLEKQKEREMQLELENKDLLLRSEIVQHSFKVLLEKLDELYEKLGERYVREPIEDIRREMREDLESISAQIRGILETLTTPRIAGEKVEKK